LVYKDKKKRREWYVKNRDRINRRRRLLLAKSPEAREKAAEINKIWREKNKEYMRERSKKYYRENKDKVNEYQKIYRKKYYQLNKTRLKQEHKDYYNKNKDEWNRRYNYNYHFKTAFNINRRLRARVRNAINYYTRTGKTRPSREYGINYKKIIDHLKPFPKDKHLYHIDHIKPLFSFNLNNPDEVRQAFAPENHQWLLAERNLTKGKMVELQQELF